MNVRILYVDDDDALVRLAQKKFGQDGIEIVHAQTPQRGMELLACEDFTLVILDHYMDGSTGIQFIQHLQEQNIQIPIVYVTATNEASIAIEAMKAGAYDFVIKTIGDEFWTLLKTAVDQAIQTSRLIRAKERADLEILRGKERAEMLLSEVNHRVANSLALVASLIRLQASSEKSELVKNALSETQARITAVASMHRSLYTTEEVSAVAMDRYVAALAEDIGESVKNGTFRAPLILNLQPIFLSSDKAVSVGMIVTELMTNAIKYAYPEGQPGEIRIHLTQACDTEAMLIVEDDGVGFSQNGPIKGTGLGSKIVMAMAKSLGSGLHYAQTVKGTRAEVQILLQ
jgi:two-component sensor histidine kinase